MGLDETGEFLALIGADRLSPSLSLAQSTQHHVAHARVSQELNQLNLDARALLAANWDTFTSQLTTTRVLTAQLDRVDSDLAVLEHDQAGLLPPLLSALSTHSSLATDHAAALASTALLSTLATLHAAIAPLADHHTFSADLVPVVLALRTLLAHPPDPWIAQTALYRALAKWARSEDQRICALLADALDEAFVLTKDPAVTLALETPIEPLLNSLAALANPGAVQSHLHRLAGLVAAHLVVPLLTSHAEVTFPSPMTLVISPTSSSSPLASIASLLAFLPAPLKPLIPLPTLLITHYLRPLLPTSLPTAAVVHALHEAEAFEPGVHDWVQDVGKHWAKTVRDHVLQQARDLVLHWDWTKTEVIPWPPLPPSVLQMPSNDFLATRPMPNLTSLPASGNSRSLPRTPLTPQVPSPTDIFSSLVSPPPPPRPLSAVSSSSTPAPSSRPVSVLSASLAYDVEADDEDEGEDAWGLGSTELDDPEEEAVETEAESASDPAVEKTLEPPAIEDQTEDDAPQESGWGFDEGGSGEGEDDGWGFGIDEDEESVIAISPQSPVTKPTPPLSAVTAPPPLPAPPPPLTSAPSHVPRGTRTISSATKTLLQVVSSVQELANTSCSPSYPYRNLFAPSSTVLASTSASLLALYRATLPAAHGQLLHAVPALALQFANDLEFLEGHQMESMARTWREEIFETQRKELMECLDAAEGFRYTGEDGVYARAEKALDQVTHSLERVSGVWKPVMDAPSFYAALGSLVDAVLQRVLDEIEAQTDISEEESIRLNKLCKRLHGLESLFDGQTSIGHEVPVWFKFVFLSELLEASMVDIIFLFDNGHLVDFSNAEIERLVRALFADSPARRDNLAHIARGSTKVARVDDSSSDEEEDGDDRWD